MVELTWFTLWYYWIPKFLMGIFIVGVIPLMAIGFFVLWHYSNKAEDRIKEKVKDRFYR